MLLTKSQFVRGFDCVRRAWLDRFRPDLKPALSTSALERIEAGKRVGILARQLYPGGVEVPSLGQDPYEAAETTQRLIADGHPTLFEATFISDGRMARVDALTRTESGWIVDEVKSSTVKPVASLKDKVPDLAFQVLTASEAGVPVERARMVLMDSKHVWPGGDYAADQILGMVGLTQECHERREEMRAVAANLAEVLASEIEPEVELNTHCKKCDYFDHCYREQPKHDLIYLPRIYPHEVHALRSQGIATIDQLPDDKKLNDQRRRIREVIVTGQPYLGEGLNEALEAIPFPAAFIDYETSNPAFPTVPGTRPYQQVCFQWSAHLMATPDSLPEHHEFLASDDRDPRPEFCKTLWEALKDYRALVHYTGFEVTQLKSMAEEGIPFAAELLQAIQARSVDLAKIVQEHVYYEDFRGSFSIKTVLPALVPELSYDGLEIGDGMAASAGYRRMIHPATSEVEALELKKALLEYCCLDTLAMVRIYQRLREYSK